MLSAASRTEEIEGKNRNLVYLFGTTREGEAIAIRTPLLMPYFQIVEPTKDILFNLEFVENPKNLFKSVNTHFKISVYEAGAGWTKSCGSGATAVASLFYGLHGAQSSNKLVIIKQEGGELKIKKIDNNILLTGPSVIEHEGMIYV